MAIIFAVVGGGVVVIATADPYSDHSDYSNYDNYSNYSDAAERRSRRLAEKAKEVDAQKFEVNSYKTETVNEYLQDESLKREPGVTVSIDAVISDGEVKIQREEIGSIENICSREEREIQEIDDVIKKINKILEEE